ncbi:hypothetical protein F2Q68_00039323 [Brassica cretica]|uniref:Agenet domain-containing protein n=1 Tax=Brassica cretica TaxID=69181 RepID=A0A8S9MQ80_BRACR|nr:hypothetical protein F2Q68_00039323 [Brassica cretica]
MILPYTSKHGNKKIFISGNLPFSDSFLLGGVKDHRLFLFKSEKTTTLDGYFINQKLQFRGYLPKLSRYKEQEVQAGRPIPPSPPPSRSYLRPSFRSVQADPKQNLSQAICNDPERSYETPSNANEKENLSDEDATEPATVIIETQVCTPVLTQQVGTEATNETPMVTEGTYDSTEPLTGITSATNKEPLTEIISATNKQVGTEATNEIPVSPIAPQSIETLFFTPIQTQQMVTEGTYDSTEPLTEIISATNKEHLTEIISSTNKQHLQTSASSPLSTLFENGADVEIATSDDATCRFWYPGNVFATNLCDGVEKVAVTLFADQKRVTVTADKIRHKPPADDREKKFEIMDNVEAFYSKGWSSGQVIMILGENTFSVYLNSSMETLEFKASDLRIHREWLDGVWKMAEETPLHETASRQGEANPDQTQQMVTEGTYDSTEPLTEIISATNKQVRTEATNETPMVTEGTYDSTEPLTEIISATNKESLTEIISATNKQEDTHAVHNTPSSPVSSLISRVIEETQHLQTSASSPLSTLFENWADVEIATSDDATCRIWYPGNVFATNLCDGVEKVVVTLFADQKRVTVTADKIRPKPPTDDREKKFEMMDNVEAFYSKSWSSGQVRMILGENTFSVYLNSSMETLEFKASDLRIHREWLVWKMADETLFHETASRQDEANPDQTQQDTKEPMNENISQNISDTQRLTRARAKILREQNKTDIRNGVEMLKVEYSTRFRDKEKRTKKLQESVSIDSIRPQPPPEDTKGFELMDKVEAYHDDGWCSGEVHIILNGVWKMEKEIEVQKTQSVKPRQDNHAKKWKHVVGMKRKATAQPVDHAKKGKLVVGMKRKTTAQPAWILDATMLHTLCNRNKIEKDFFEYLDNAENNLKEKESVSIHSIRPQPPPGDTKGFELMDKVEAYHNDGWCSGEVHIILRKPVVGMKRKATAHPVDHAKKGKPVVGMKRKATAQPIDRLAFLQRERKRPIVPRNPPMPVTPEHVDAAFAMLNQKRIEQSSWFSEQGIPKACFVPVQFLETVGYCYENLQKPDKKGINILKGWTCGSLHRGGDTSDGEHNHNLSLWRSQG